MAYLQKKLYQQDKQQVCEQRHGENMLKYEMDFKTILKKRVNTNANNIAQGKLDVILKQRKLVECAPRETKEEL
jgi:hypothetical protein